MNKKERQPKPVKNLSKMPKNKNGNSPFTAQKSDSVKNYQHLHGHGFCEFTSLKRLNKHFRKDPNDDPKINEMLVQANKISLNSQHV